MFVVLREETEGDGGHWIVAPASIQCSEQTPALLQANNYRGNVQLLGHLFIHMQWNL